MYCNERYKLPNDMYREGGFDGSGLFWNMFFLHRRSSSSSSQGYSYKTSKTQPQITGPIPKQYNEVERFNLSKGVSLRGVLATVYEYNQGCSDKEAHKTKTGHTDKTLRLQVVYVCMSAKCKHSN